MSYIRSTSNSEGLYVFEDGDKVACFMVGGKYRLRVPLQTFKILMKRVAKDWGWGRSFSYKGFKISENTKTFKWKIAYKSDYMNVYEVTLKYMLDNNKWD